MSIREVGSVGLRNMDTEMSNCGRPRLPEVSKLLPPGGTPTNTVRMVEHRAVVGQRHDVVGFGQPPMLRFNGVPSPEAWAKPPVPLPNLSSIVEDLQGKDMKPSLRHVQSLPKMSLDGLHRVRSMPAIRKVESTHKYHLPAPQQRPDDEEDVWRALYELRNQNAALEAELASARQEHEALQNKLLVKQSSRNVGENKPPRRYWEKDEHNRFLEGLRLYKKDMTAVAKHVGTRTPVQVRTHAQKHFLRMAKLKRGQKMRSMSETDLVGLAVHDELDRKDQT